jgi:hypothetical protein
MSRVLRGVGVVVGVLALMALSLLALLMMGRVPFIVPGVVRNASAHAIEVIPVGRWETTGSAVGRAPLYRAKWVPILRGGPPLVVAPGETTTFLYDFDDINLCWLLVKEERNWKVLPTTLDSSGPCALEKSARGKPCCAALPEDAQVVPPTETLADAPPWLACLADDTCS